MLLCIIVCLNYNNFRGKFSRVGLLFGWLDIKSKVSQSQLVVLFVESMDRQIFDKYLSGRILKEKKEENDHSESL